MSEDSTVIRFDRGTLLVSGARAVVEGLPGVLWDGRVSSYRAPACCYRDLRAALGSDGVEDHLGLVAATPTRIEQPELRPYQKAALAAWRSAGNRGVVVMPPGSGKTHVALGAMASLTCPTLVLVPTRVLLGQWVERCSRFVEQPIGVVGDGERNVTAFTICTFESALAQMDRMGQQFSLVVVDEAHHLGRGLRVEALEMCAAPSRLGLTATPPKGLVGQDQIERLVGPVVSCHTISDLSGGHLAPFQRVRIRVRLSPEESRSYHRSHSSFTDGYRAFVGLGRGPGGWHRWAAGSQEGRAALRGITEARRIVATAGAKLAVATELLQLHRHERVLVFTSDNAAAYLTSRVLLIPAITCDIRRGERREILTRLGDGRCRAVVSAQVLNEGLDLPECSVGIVLGASQGGERESAQRLGRLLRPSPGKHALLYELVAERTFEVKHAED